MNTVTESISGSGTDELPILQAAQRLDGPKDGTGIGSMAADGVVDGWASEYLVAKGDPADREALLEAFRFGVRADGWSAGKSFVETEPQLRSEWSSQKNRLPWEAVRDAAWAGFDRARDRRG
ncbi:hypothetical protein [Gemmata sp.]|uniref:hypothetical protein n=1 Tax=Gemmata sp. TaxID=1914242 RepID=UPI003F724D3B